MFLIILGLLCPKMGKPMTVLGAACSYFSAGLLDIDQSKSRNVLHLYSFNKSPILAAISRHYMFTL